MRQDQQTYRRAQNAAAIGLFFQALLLLVMLLTAFWAKSKGLTEVSTTLFPAAMHLLGGIPIWIILWMVYNAHRLERLESFEAEQLAADDAQMAALFDEHADELQLSKKRLRNLYKFGINGVSLFVAAFLLIVGSIGAWNNFQAGATGALFSGAEGIARASSTVMALTVLMAFVAFVAARYIAGMTKVDDWRMLRGGAGYLMGTAVASGLAFIASLLGWLGEPIVFAYLAVVYPILIALLGLEIVLSYMFSAYRPRRPGELPKPAFESRLLGWLTAPESIAKIVNETINYQFGFEVSKSWFYRLLGRAITPLFAFGILTLLALSSIVVVAPNEQAIITRGGGITHEQPLGPGLHIKAPWPFSSATKYAVGRVHQIIVGSSHHLPEAGKAILWTNQHLDGEEFMITAPTAHSQEGVGEDDKERKAAGMGLIGAQVIIQYTVSDLMQFVKTAPFPYEMLMSKHEGQRDFANRILISIAERRVNRYFVTHEVDTLLGHGGVMAGADLAEEIQSDVNDAGLGLKILMVSLSGVHPPQESVAGKFLEQIGAKQERETTIEKAKAEAIGVLAKVAGSHETGLKIGEAIQAHQATKAELEKLRAAEQRDETTITAKTKQQIDQEVMIERLINTSNGSASRMLAEARAIRWSLALEEHGKAIMFKAQARAYRNAPKYYVMRRYLEALETGLDQARMFVVASDSKDKPIIRLDLKDGKQLKDWLKTDE